MTVGDVIRELRKQADKSPDGMVTEVCVKAPGMKDNQARCIVKVIFTVSTGLNDATIMIEHE